MINGVLVLVLLCLGQLTLAQKQPGQMNVVELEVYKKRMIREAEAKMKRTAAANQVVIDENMLPGAEVKLPVKDLQRLSALPLLPPRKEALVQQAAVQERKLKDLMEVDARTATEKMAAGMSAAELHTASMAYWYEQDPQSALILGLKSVQKAPDSVTGWNNLAALYNMSGLEQLAVPMLQYARQLSPRSAIVTNNLGQAYLGMGDVATAKKYFGECLAFDPFHPEANQTMGIICLAQKDPVSAVKYFEKELAVANRKSTLNYLEQAGLRDKVNLARLRLQRMEAQGVPEHDFFGEIAFGKFELPSMPMTCDYSDRWQQQMETYIQSVEGEYNFWLQSAISEQSTEEKRLAVHYLPGVYSDLVTELLHDLDEAYLPYLNIGTPELLKTATWQQEQYAKQLMAIECPEPKADEVFNADVVRAYEKKCCDLKKPVIDKYMTMLNGVLYDRYRAVNGQWKQYLNAMIRIVQLNPSESNRRKVYQAFSQYFAFLTSTVQLVAAEDLPGECRTGLTASEADSIIKSNRDLKLICPSFLNFKLKLGMATIKANCETFGVEGEFAKYIRVGVERKIKTGTSTVYAGVSLDAKMLESKAGLYQQFYITFDRNYQFADVGARGGGKVELAGGVYKMDAGYDLSLNSGFNPVAKKSDWVDRLARSMAAGR
jgi:Tfp pilus assembly protein PilF